MEVYFLSSFKIENMMDCNKESNKLNSNAIQKLLTAKLFKSSLASKMIKAFITNRNRPRVITVIGKVSMTRIGFKMAFKSAKTMATMMAPVKPATSTPGRNFAKTTTATAVSKILMISFMFIVCWLLNISILFYKIIYHLKKFGRILGM